MKELTISELIDFLKLQPQDLTVAYTCYSEQVLLNVSDIRVVERCEPREDGWIQNARPDKAIKKYLLFSGN